MNQWCTKHVPDRTTKELEIRLVQLRLRGLDSRSRAGKTVTREIIRINSELSKRVEGVKMYGTEILASDSKRKRFSHK